MHGGCTCTFDNWDLREAKMHGDNPAFALVLLLTSAWKGEEVGDGGSSDEGDPFCRTIGTLTTTEGWKWRMAQL